MAGACGPSEGCAEYPLSHDRRCRLRRPFDFRWRHSDTNARSHRRQRLRYINFHTTAMCSPTRAAIITGRNHHSVGYGPIGEVATGFPGCNSIIPKDAATIGRILLENGYRTSWFGKDHNTPTYQTSQAGPFDQWPTGMGFEYFYGYVAGDTSQWTPLLYRNTTRISPYVGHPGWNLTTAMADEAIGWLNELNSINPSMPFFSLLCSRRNARAASTDTRMDQEIYRHALVRQRLECVA